MANVVLKVGGQKREGCCEYLGEEGCNRNKSITMAQKESMGSTTLLDRRLEQPLVSVNPGKTKPVVYHDV